MPYATYLGFRSNVITIIGSEQDSPYMMRVSSNGYVKWNPAAAFNTQCDADTTYYPYDTQSCNITIAVWLHSVDEVNVTLFNDGFYLANYQQDGEWELGSYSAVRDEFHDAGQQYAKVDLTLNLKRRRSYYILNIIIPLILIGALNVFVFLYPPDPGTRSGFAITVLLTYYVLLTVVADKLPTTSRYVSILGK